MHMSNELSRRGFMGVVGAMAGAAAFAGTALADEATPDIEGVVTSPEVEALGGSTMSIHELNRRRHELVDSRGNFECSDGSTVPAVWNKLRTLVNTYGTGIGSDMSDKGPEAFAFWQRLFTEDETQAYIEMPYGVMFSAAEFAAETGRDEAECEALCEDLAARNLLFRCRRAGVPFYHHIAVYHGMFEYNLNKLLRGGLAARPQQHGGRRRQGRLLQRRQPVLLRRAGQQGHRLR